MSVSDPKAKSRRGQRRLPEATRQQLLEALYRLRNAAAAAAEIGVHPTTAWRLAKSEGVELQSLSEHMKQRRRAPAFLARQKPAQRDAARRWLKAKHRDATFHARSVAVARATMVKRNADPEFRKKSAKRLKARYADPAFRRRQAAKAAAGMRRWHREKSKKLKSATAVIRRANAIRHQPD